MATMEDVKKVQSHREVFPQDLQLCLDRVCNTVVRMHALQLVLDDCMKTVHHQCDGRLLLDLKALIQSVGTSTDS